MAGSFDPISRCPRCDKPAYLMGKSGFHICLDRSPEVMQQTADLVEPKPKKKRPPSKVSRGDHSEETKQLIGEKSRARWDAVREANKERDAYILEQYQLNRTVRSISEELGIGYVTCNNILIRFEEAGELVRRPKGVSPAILERNQKILAQFQDRTPISKIAADYGLTQQQVRRVLAKVSNGEIKLRQGIFAKEFESRNEEIVDLYGTGEWTIPKLAERYSISINSITKILRAADATKGQAKGDTTERDAEIVKKYRNYATMRDLAEEYKLGRETIRDILRTAEELGEVVIRPGGPGGDTVREKNNEIRSKAGLGTSHKKLAEEYGLTTRQIRQIIRNGAANGAGRVSV